MQPPADDDEQKQRRVRWLADAYSLGFTFPAAVLIGLGGGWWLDKHFRTWPWLTVILGACGVAAGFVALFRLATRDDGTGK